jgi:phosphoenolpyruvate carboxykinase (ATP)
MEQTFNQNYYGIENHGIKNVNKVYRNLSTPALYEEAIQRREGTISHMGPFVVRTGQHTGRSPNDKFVVKEPSSEKKICWGNLNKPIEEEKFNIIYQRLLAYLQGRDIFIQDCLIGADPHYQIPIRVITEDAWHSLFARNMFLQVPDEQIKDHVPDFTIINLPKFLAVPEIDGTNSDAFVIINLGERVVLIGGTSYAGEIKKSIFTILNYMMPRNNVLPMRCSANVGIKCDVALFFGLTGTGKTALSIDTKRMLIGDDGHGWSEEGIYNFEGGGYAKVINLAKENQPEIYETTRKFGTILENVAMNYRTRRFDLDDSSLTENTRSIYPITHIPNAARKGMADHPKNIIMLTCDAFGIMPPVSKLTTEQARNHFLSGYTTRLIKTEKGVLEPFVTFSPCFGASFMVLHPTVYTNLFIEKVVKHEVTCWLVNTGWSGGPYGFGSRMKIQSTRSIINAIYNGSLNNVEYKTEPFFGLNIPKECPGFQENEILDPKNTWKNKDDYNQRAEELALLFEKNYNQFK